MERIFLLSGRFHFYHAVQADGGGGFFRQYGLFAAITDMNPQPYEPEKYLIVLGISILLFIAGIILNRRYFH